MSLREDLSLNDDSVSDLAGTPSYIKPPEDGAGEKEGVTVLETSESGEKTDKLSEGELLEAVKSTEVLISTSVDDQEKLHDLEDVTKVVMAQESISSSEALALDKTLDGKLSEAVGLNRFTDAPTKVGLPLVKDFVASYVDQTKQAAQESHQKLQEAFPQWSAVVQTKIHEYFEILRSAAEALRMEAQSFVSESPSDRRYHVYVTQRPDSLIDLRKAQLNSYCSANVQVDDVELKKLSAVVDKLMNLRLTKMGTVIRLASFGAAKPDMGVFDQNGESLNAAVANLISIASIMANPDLISQIDTLVESIQMVTPEDSPEVMAKKMRDQNNLITVAVELNCFFQNVSAYFKAMHQYRESVSL